MADACCRVPEAGSAVCEQPAPGLARPSITLGTCPICGECGKPVQGQTVKSLLAISLRAVRDAQYHFCRNRDCPVVYFSSDGQRQFTTAEVREHVFQKEPDAAQVPVCYCFDYRVGTLRTASGAERDQIIAEINAGIQAGQCACDLRNPQGSCCLGNVRLLGRQRTAPLVINSDGDPDLTGPHEASTLGRITGSPSYPPLRVCGAADVTPLHKRSGWPPRRSPGRLALVNLRPCVLGRRTYPE